MEYDLDVRLVKKRDFDGQLRFQDFYDDDDLVSAQKNGGPVLIMEAVSDLPFKDETIYEVDESYGYFPAARPYYAGTRVEISFPEKPRKLPASTGNPSGLIMEYEDVVEGADGA